MCLGGGMHCPSASSYHYWATVCKTVRHKLSDRCLSICPVCSVLSVTLVYCGQTVGQVKMKLGTPWPHCVTWGPSSAFAKGAQPQFFGPIRSQNPPPIFGPCLLCLLCPNGWMDQDATWYGCRARSKRHCVTWGPSFPSPKGGRAPIFGSWLLWPNGRPSQLLLSTCYFWAH